MPVITLLTDFGTVDEYVGVMKGVILSICPSATVIDITHGIPPQDRVWAAYLLESGYRCFPPGTIHLAVVDPGVGTDRAILAAEVGDYIVVAPDNGVLTRLLTDNDLGRVVSVTNPDFFRPRISRTFHGRDIFAPVAAHLARGADLEQLGPEIDPRRGGVVRLDLSVPELRPDGELVGTVVGSDRFGNLMTDIDEETLSTWGGAGQPVLMIGDHRVTGLATSYADVPLGAPLMIVNSREYLEIAINGGSAESGLGLRRGEPVRLVRSRINDH